MLSTRPTAPGLQDFFPVKTPARSKSRAENVIRHGAPMTVHGKSKIQRTPFPQSARHKKHASVNLKEGISLTGDVGGGKPVILNTRPAARPLGDKTPFPNRASKAGAAQDIGMQKGELHQKLPKLLDSLYPSLSNQEGAPEFSPRPSSTRKSARAPRSASKNFQTPLVNGNPWDVSDGSIELGDVQVQDVQGAEMEDLDEIEYMPPNTLDLPYQPPFDFELPNYTEVGKSLWNLVHSCPVDDTPIPEHESDMSDFKPNWDLLPTLKNLSDEVDDPFYRAKALPSRTTATKAIAPRSMTGSKITRNTVSRTTSAASIKGSTTSATTTTTTTTTRIGMSRPSTAPGAVGRPITRSVSAKAAATKAAEAPRRPASAVGVGTTSRRPLGASTVTGKPRVASTVVTKQYTKTASRESVKAGIGKGTTGSATEASRPLKGIKEERGASSGHTIPVLEIANDFLFEV